MFPFNFAKRMLFKDRKKFNLKIFFCRLKSDVFIFIILFQKFKLKKVKKKILYSSIIEGNLHNLTVKDFFFSLSQCHLLADDDASSVRPDTHIFVMQ